MSSLQHNSLLIDSVRLAFGTHLVLSGAYITSETGKVTGLLGRNGSVYGYGYNSFGQIIPDGQNKSMPTLIMDSCIGCGAGTHYSAAIKADGTLMIWGNNTCGVIGDGMAADRNYEPTAVMKLK